jgi:lipopolysaccharide transport system ATP-binding protein
VSVKAIAVEGLWKQYRYGTTGYVTLRHDLESWWARLRGREDPNAEIGHEPAAPRVAGGADRFWALQDVGFTVEPGEIVGIVGRNGAGKSTLLKVMSRVTAPTRGFVKLRGRVASLLEVGTGFHPELTGRENVFLNGTILGMSRAEVRARFDEIVEFAEMARFIDTPVKRYSSGMAVRLGFAVAAHLDPEILLVDEVLAVGDAGFQSKCVGKIGEVGRAGRAVLFVSHNLGMVAKLCTRGIVLRQGAVVADGGISGALQAYAGEFRGREGWEASDFAGNLKAILRFDSVAFNGECSVHGLQVSPARPLSILVRGEALQEIPEYRTTFSIYRDGRLLIVRHDGPAPTLLPRGRFEAEFTLPAFFLTPGEYTFEFGGYSPGTRQWLWSAGQTPFGVIAEWHADYDTGTEMGLVNLPGCGERRTFGDEGAVCRGAG